MKKTLIGLIVGAIMLLIGMLVSQVFHAIFPSLKAEYENPNLFRPWSDPLMSLMFVQPLLVGIILAWIWDFTKGILKGNALMEKGLFFGFIYWITTIPGMIMSYGSFPTSLIMVISWSVSLFVQSLLAGVLFARLIK